MRPFGLNHRFPCRRTRPGVKRAATQDEPIEALSSTARGPAPPRRRGRTSALKLHPQQRRCPRVLRSWAEQVRQSFPSDNPHCQSASASPAKLTRQSFTLDHSSCQGDSASSAGRACQRFPQTTGTSSRRIPFRRDDPANPLDNRYVKSQSRVQQRQQGSCYQLSSISRMCW